MIIPGRTKTGGVGTGVGMMGGLQSKLATPRQLQQQQQQQQPVGLTPHAKATLAALNSNSKTNANAAGRMIMPPLLGNGHSSNHYSNNYMPMQMPMSASLPMQMRMPLNANANASSPMYPRQVQPLDARQHQQLVPLQYAQLQRRLEDLPLH